MPFLNYIYQLMKKLFSIAISRFHKLETKVSVKFLESSEGLCSSTPAAS